MEHQVGNKELYVIVRNSEQILYDGLADAVTSFNEKGKFDIIPLHTNFISIVKDKIIIHEKGGKEAEINCEHGVLKVLSNHVNIFLGVDSLA
jgi:F0F1-type ATP synthase epsilon subunit